MSVFHQKGVTLIELMIGLSILAILATLAGPAFIETIQNGKMISQTNGLLGDLHIARSEAGKRSALVQMCISSNKTSCNVSSGNDWSQGWIVWQDINADTNVDPVEIIRAHAGLSSQTTLLTTGKIENSIQFDEQGLTGMIGSFTMCDPRGGDHAKAIVIGPSGRARITQHDHLGAVLSC